MQVGHHFLEEARMNKAARTKLFVVVTSIVLAIASAISAKQPEQPQPSALPASAQEKPAEQKPAAQQPHPETLQILKGMPRPQIIQTMRNMASALGVEC